MFCLGIEPVTAGWYWQTDPLSCSGLQTHLIVFHTFTEADIRYIDGQKYFRALFPDHKMGLLKFVRSALKQSLLHPKITSNFECIDNDKIGVFKKESKTKLLSSFGLWNDVIERGDAIRLVTANSVTIVIVAKGVTFPNYLQSFCKIYFRLQSFTE